MNPDAKDILADVNAGIPPKAPRPRGCGRFFVIGLYLLLILPLSLILLDFSGTGTRLKDFAQ